ncbi:hypothetical protein NDI37_26875 [Funiculus sociatus GB2-A5]|uniref:Uncharacterized protein n=2 Tax=Funiculus TaxID=2886342 RepID=A0ABV0JX81_9CYAN|nr:MULTISPECIES: hypothetical protein [unclassified Trichocoleus]MBD1905923.1 hypothetical protein [Trichocoleus sp. FACHB-832]
MTHNRTDMEVPYLSTDVSQDFESSLNLKVIYMIIKAKRIRNLELHFRWLPPGKRIVFGVSAIDRFQSLLTKIGFTDTLQIGESVLPPPAFGSISRFNALGKLIIHKDRPKETAYRMVEWHWQEWRGKNSSEEQSKLVDVPYKRYPRTFVLPPSVELKIAAQSQEGEKLITSPMMTYDKRNRTQLLHTINLFLDIFGECQVFHENLDAIINVPIKHLNWTVLPPGRYPWSRLKSQVQSLIQRVPTGNQKMIDNRLETINKHEPDFVAVGRAGFRGYIIFGFTAKNLFVLESIYFGNATYILGERWEELSALTKAEILSEHLHKDRVIHRVGWHRQIQKLLFA